MSCALHAVLGIPDGVSDPLDRLIGLFAAESSHPIEKDLSLFLAK